MMMSTLTAALAAVLASALPVAARPVPPDANPALWVVGDEDTVIYLFGTFHALDGKSDWFNDEVRSAFDSSGELVLEALIPEDPAELQPMMMKHFYRPSGGPRVVGAPVMAGKSTSFLASTQRVMAAGRSAGMSIDFGADHVLRRAARQSGKSVGGLESFESQLGMMSRIPAPAKTPTEAQTRAALSAVPGALRKMQAAWNAGDSESFVPFLDAMRAQSPETYRTLFDERNARWAEWIAVRLATPGTVFVAVGSGHLAGKDSVQHKLAARGIKSARLS